MQEKRYALEKPVNFRDLGGLTGAQGRCIQPARLLRSGEVRDIGPYDAKRLTEDYRLSVIVDLRGAGEVERSPDQSFPDVAYHNFDLHRSFHQVASSEKNLERMQDLKMVDTFMRQAYEALIVSQDAQEGLRDFLEVLLAQKQGATLFHCFAGKDRTGVAAAVALTALGVSEADIMADYLLTNRLRQAANEEIQAQMRSQGASEDMVASMGVAMSVKEEYLLHAYDVAAQHYGSFAGFLRGPLGMDETRQQALQQLYLEP